MKYLFLIYFLLIIIFIFGCAKGNSIVDIIREGKLETKGIINVALASKGAIVTVSEDNEEHPASTLINGITDSSAWDRGEGWEAKYEGRFARGGYLNYGMEDPRLAEERGRNENYNPGDPSWRGLRMDTSYGGSVNTALGWAIIQFPEEKTVNRAVIHTIDSEKYPAEKFGVSDLMIQYWSEKVSSWLVVERLGKSKGQQGNTIQNNKKGIINIRFQPVNTTKLRFVIRWTNDSDRYTRGYYTYSSGTIRLLEIEVFGYEEEDVMEESITAEAVVVQDYNKIAEIEVVIDNYVDAYNRRNIDMLMASIAIDYLKDGEAYLDFKKRIESIFEKYPVIKLELKNVKVKFTDKGATATATYLSQYSENIDGSLPIKSSGELVFELSNTNGYWKISKIDSNQ